jgi:hypothetical protein
MPRLTIHWRRCAAFAVLAVLAAALAARGLCAQETGARLAGRVVVRGTDAPLGNATLQVEGTELATRSDSLGRWALQNVPVGPQVLNVRRVGYAPVRLPVSVPVRGTRTLDVVMAVSALQLEQVTVTADRVGRARGELGTATVIDRDAIANQVATSLQGVLELVPGVVLQPPGLDAPAQFSLRTLAQSPTGGLTAGGPSAADIGAAGTLIVLDGVPLSNNANLQTVGARGETVPAASTSGGGVDIRRIPAATLERVEVIRGVPSARWGDLTQGTIIVDTRAAATPPEILARLDPRTAEGSVVGGGDWQDERQALTVAFNLAQTAATRTLSSATTVRGAGQLAHRLELGVAPAQGPAQPDQRPLPRAVFDTRADWYLLRYEAPERVDVEPGRNSFQDDRGLRISERARVAMGGGALELTAAYDAQAQETRETRFLSRPTLPFTDRTSEGRAVGRYIEGQYLSAYTLEGAPRLLYSRLEWERSSDGHANEGAFSLAQLRAGLELRREWNGGAGYEFPLDAPPQTTINGVNGFDRPRPFDDVPPLVTSAYYADTRLVARRGQLVAELQPGLRLDVLHEGSWWASGSRSAVPQPRLTAQVSPRPWVRVRGGVGVVSKLPTVAQLFPAVQWFDVVNVNRFTPDPAERLAVLTTFIRDPTNDELEPSRATKREVALELDGGRRVGSVGLTWFNDAVAGAVTLRRDPAFLLRDRYALADTGLGTGQPGRIVDPPIGADTIPIFLDRYVNGGALDSRGVEFTVAFPEVPTLHTRLEASGAVVETRFSTDDRDFGPINTVTTFVTDTAVKRLAVFEGARQRARRSILTWRLVHHQPDLGLVVTATAQQLLTDRRYTDGQRDSLSFVGYLTRSGTLVTVPREQRLAPEYADLRRARAGGASASTSVPSDWLLSLQVVKSLPANGRLSFYFFNALDKQLTVGSSGSRIFPSTRFGAELTLQTRPIVDALFGRDR